MVAFNPVTGSATSGGSSGGGWQDIFGPINDIFKEYNKTSLQKKKLSYANNLLGQRVNAAGYAVPSGPAGGGSFDYQKMGFIIGLVGVAVAVLAFVLKR